MFVYAGAFGALVVMAYRNLRQEGHTKRFEAWLLSLDMKMQDDE